MKPLILASSRADIRCERLIVPSPPAHRLLGAFFILLCILGTVLVPGLHANAGVFEQQPAPDGAWTAQHSAPTESEVIRERRRKAEEGDPRTQYVRGTDYENGEGVPKSFEEVERWYRRSADQGFAGAQRALASCIPPAGASSGTMRASFEQRRDSLLDRVSAADRDAGQRRAKEWLEQFGNDRPHYWPLSADPALP